ncbi:MAG: glycosyltransferase [Verrucomicrobiota bacterium]
MKIAMFTNTYLPHVGGVAKSVKTLEDGCRALGHEVRIIAPDFDDYEPSPHVLRVPSIRDFNGSGFCVRLPGMGSIRDFMDGFQPDIIHSHHPFLLGDTALREAWKSQIPIVFTHHTLYERYTHYMPFDSPAMKRAVVKLAAEYSNLCDLTIAPSESIAELLRERGVITDIEVVPTGVDTQAFGCGRGSRFRRKFGIPEEAKVIGHVGRLAKEKNLDFLAKAVAICLKDEPNAVFLLVGDGECRDTVLELLESGIGESRIYYLGKQTGDDLVDAYAAMDCFAFTSQSETQGMVLAEAMAAGTPVVALDGPGVREIVHGGENGLLLDGEASAREFADALLWIIEDEEFFHECSENTLATAAEFDVSCCVDKVLASYKRLIAEHSPAGEEASSGWDRIINGIQIEWDLLAARVSAASAAITEAPVAGGVS